MAGTRNPMYEMCSTPVGVTVVGTGRRGRRGRPVGRAPRLSASLGAAPQGVGGGSAPTRVLNACRRHCGRHRDIDGYSLYVGECSTPVGVTVVGTVGRKHDFVQGTARAQRLSASLWSALSKT